MVLGSEFTKAFISFSEATKSLIKDYYNQEILTVDIMNNCMIEIIEDSPVFTYGLGIKEFVIGQYEGSDFVITYSVEETKKT